MPRKGKNLKKLRIMKLNKHPVVFAKVGTHSSTRLVLWKPYAEGDTWVLAMELSQWENSHWSYRRLKKCNFWQRLFVDKVSPEGFMYLTK